MARSLYEAAQNATQRLQLDAPEPWLSSRAEEVDHLVRLAAAEEAEVARQRRIGRYAPRNLTEPPGRKLRRKLIKEPPLAQPLQEAIVGVIGLGWLLAAPANDEGYRHHPKEALWNAWTVSFVTNDALDGVEWASRARDTAASFWKQDLKAAGLWPIRGRMRMRFVAYTYFGAGVVLHLLQRNENISQPMVTMTAKWPMRDLPVLSGGD